MTAGRIHVPKEQITAKKIPAAIIIVVIMAECQRPVRDREREGEPLFEKNVSCGCYRRDLKGGQRNAWISEK